MEKLYKTKTYGNMSLQLGIRKSKLSSKGIEVKAKVNLDTGEVNLFIEPEDLEVLREIEAEKEE
ncbi:hypothetical protein [Enterococcus sp.]|uniref:hypothetical protein n=1 Tax=Enterococcus sp. TaxID=35783 RepID=UPI0029143EBC|nr:hypothetical protein [Enterococcus sp.]MDU5336392.1 hypothetical protein [Enterococcus sp.]